MSVRLEHQAEQVIAYLSGEIDHHNAKEMREKIDFTAERVLPRILVLDFGGVTFMDSSGIGLIMGRYRLMHSANGRLIVRNASPHIRRVMQLAGMDKLAVLEENNREGREENED